MGRTTECDRASAHRPVPPLFAPHHQQDVAAGHFKGSTLAALVCGQKEMSQAVTAILEGQGVPKERILSNF